MESRAERRDLMATFEDVQRLAADLPEVAESTSYGTPALKVRGKALRRALDHG